MAIFCRASWVVLALGLVASPVDAQLMNDPVQLSPKGEVGLTVAGDVGQGINGASGSHTSFNGRVTLGLPWLQVTVGVGLERFKGVFLVNANQGATGSSTLVGWQPAATRANFMGLAALQLIPSTPTVPISVAFFAGVGHASAWGSTLTTVPVGLAVGLELSSSGTSIEPWIAPRFSRLHTSGQDAETDSGVSGGLNVGLSMGLGFQAAVDYLKVPGDSPVIASIGVRYRFNVPGLGTVSG